MDIQKFEWREHIHRDACTRCNTLLPVVYDAYGWPSVKGFDPAKAHLPGYTKHDHRGYVYRNDVICEPCYTTQKTKSDEMRFRDLSDSARRKHITDWFSLRDENSVVSERTAENTSTCAACDGGLEYIWRPFNRGFCEGHMFRYGLGRFYICTDCKDRILNLRGRPATCKTCCQRFPSKTKLHRHLKDHPSHIA